MSVVCQRRGRFAALPSPQVGRAKTRDYVAIVRLNNNYPTVFSVIMDLIFRYQKNLTLIV